MEMAKEEDEKTKESSEDAPEVSRGYGVVGSSRAPVMPSEKIPIKSDLVMIDWSDEKMIHERSLIEETR